MTDKPMSDAKPRVLWIHEAFKIVGTSNWTVREVDEKPPEPTGYQNDWLKVIEKSAFEAVTKERDEYVNEAEHFQNKCIDLDQANGILVKERDAAISQLRELRAILDTIQAEHGLTQSEMDCVVRVDRFLEGLEGKNGTR